MINFPEIPKHKIDETWNKKLKELMAKGEDIFNDVKVSVSCAKCDFVTESHKELLKHKRMHRLSRSTRLSK